MLTFGGVLYHDMIHDMIITLQFGLDSTWIPENEKECYIGVPPPGPGPPGPQLCGATRLEKSSRLDDHPWENTSEPTIDIQGLC